MKNETASQQNGLTLESVEYLLSPVAIRAQARVIFEATERGESSYFIYHPDRLAATVDLVISVIRENYPALKIPFHSRWGHFRVGGVDRVAALDQKLFAESKLERARAKLDLVVVSVLLDAGAGMGWSYKEASSGKSFSKSEGLALASLTLFESGALSSDGKSLRADSDGLQKFNAETLKKYFQVTDSNPLIGIEGRVRLLNNLGEVLSRRELFNQGRPGNILDYLRAKFGETIPATSILRAVLDGLGPIWPGRIQMEGRNMGDVWKHSKFGLVPFHKLSQWMTYSLIEPFLEAGFDITGVEKMTGLAEYRNGGLILDSGLVTFKDAADSEKTWTPETDLIIEWRALTVHLLDVLAAEIRSRLNLSEAEFPLAKALEGGTWWTGRRLAREKRSDGGPPLKIQSDGTVF